MVWIACVRIVPLLFMGLVDRKILGLTPTLMNYVDKEKINI